MIKAPLIILGLGFCTVHALPAQACDPGLKCIVVAWSGEYWSGGRHTLRRPLAKLSVKRRRPVLPSKNVGMRCTEAAIAQPSRRSATAAGLSQSAYEEMR